jgi:chitinase
VLTGYWQNFNNGARVLKIADVPTTYDIIAVSFADAVPGTPGAVTFALDPGLSSALGGYTDAQFKADIRTVKARGQKVILSVGGQNGTISVGDATSSNNFANSMSSLIANYGFDGVDIDLENGVNATHMGSALRKIYAAGGKIITMAPQTIDMQSTSGGYFQLALAIKDILTIVNMQYYNSGSMLGCDQKVYSQGGVDFITALACIQLQGGLRADQVGLGLPASTSGAGSGYVSPQTVNNALSCLARGASCGSFKPSTTYPAIRGAMTWSINWDASNGWAFANAVAPHLDSLP